MCSRLEGEVFTNTPTAFNPLTQIERNDAQTEWNSDHPTSIVICV